ncbi:E3 ubiquitin-protein ligase RFWD3 [Bicyclus anynana]|uniref:RING-type E3 ubiquitin transferase n=1 Tax=Bicyclus anynana TaxID=110368 RepID=A0ABM3M3M4_BICAN|nr:E3 ubiquitin-protein ligase RFWD3 [Bicyclus anynana]XP_052746091.1 E3 ubiquitin-protein ligase RFWD3 [Bicyclus anynana]
MEEDSEDSRSSAPIPSSPGSPDILAGYPHQLSGTDTRADDSDGTVSYNVATEDIGFDDDSNNAGSTSRESQSILSSSQESRSFQPVVDFAGSVHHSANSSQLGAPGSSQRSAHDHEHERSPDDESQPSKKKKLNDSVQEEGETCPICLEAWGTSGAHRLVALRCGHVFGQSCVSRWLRARRCCPTCKRGAALKDLRHIYARRLVAADTAQVAALQAQLDQLQAEKMKSDMELEKCRIAHRACMMQLEDLRKSLLKNQVKEQPARRSWRFALERNLELNRDGGCRVLTYNCRTSELYVSQRSTNQLFPGYGVRKVNCYDFKLGQFLFLHTKCIRDITYSRPRDLLLSVGFDNSARIVERGILSHTIQCGMQLWSCSWDYLRTNEFYVGGVGGEIQQYDIRNPSTCLQKLKKGGDCSPTISLASTEHGLLSCQINSSWLWRQDARQWAATGLPLAGPFVSMAYDGDNHKVLLTCRAGATERSRLSLFKVKSVNSEVVVEYEKTFPGSTRTNIMCRSAFVKAPGATWVAGHSESDATLYLHGLDGSKTVSLPASEPTLDVCAAQGDPSGAQGMLLAAVSDSRLRLYKAFPVP